MLPNTSRKVFARSSVNFMDLERIENRCAMRRSWTGATRMKSKNPVNTEGPNYIEQSA